MALGVFMRLDESRVKHYLGEFGKLPDLVKGQIYITAENLLCSTGLLDLGSCRESELNYALVVETKAYISKFRKQQLAGITN